MTIRAPFEPRRGASQSVTTGAASASVAIDPVAKSVRLVNVGATNPCHVRIGKGAQTATIADLIIRANSEIIVQKGDGEDTLAYIQSGGATTLVVQTGEGGV
jgi:hypothetical protein